MFLQPQRKLLPTLIFLLLAGCGGGSGTGATSGSGVTSLSDTPNNSTPTASASNDSTPATTTTPTPSIPATSVTSAQPTLAAATVLADGTPVGAAVFADGSAASGGQGQPVSGLSCTLPGASYHYAHLAIFQNGQQIAVPTRIGVVGPTQSLQTGCAYPLHTDDASGKIRIDASATAPTLGQFFAVWGQPLSATGVAGLSGQSVVAYINDGGTLSRYSGDLSAIELKANREITLVVDTAPATIPTYAWTDPPPLNPVPTVLQEQSVGVTTWPDGNTATGGQGQAVDGLACGNMSEDFHVHAHLTIIKDGQTLAVPAELGILSTCYYSIHTHNPSGELHVEAPVAAHFTLGQFFDIWGEPLSSSNVAGLTGEPIKVYVSDNGDLRQYIGNPADIELTSHRSITIQIGSAPNSIPTYTWDTDK